MSKISNNFDIFKYNAALISESDWNAINETLYLRSVPGMRESTKEELEENVAECSKDIDW